MKSEGKDAKPEAFTPCPHGTKCLLASDIQQDTWNKLWSDISRVDGCKQNISLISTIQHLITKM